MGNSIRLHPEHGLNPTCCACFWCGETTGEIAMLGAAYKGEAPMHMALNYEPCDTCKEQFAKGILLVEVTDTPNYPRQPTINGTHYPTGSIAVITEEALSQIFREESVAIGMQSRKALLGPDTWAALGLSK